MKPLAATVLTGLTIVSSGCLQEGRPFDEYKSQYDQWVESLPPDMGVGTALDVSYIAEADLICSTAPSEFAVTLFVDNLREQPVAAYEVTEECELVRHDDAVAGETEYETFGGVVWRFTEPDDPTAAIKQYDVRELLDRQRVEVP